MSDKVEIRQALARGYCTERNDHKILDSFLIEDMALEIEKIYESKIAEKQSRIDRAVERCKEYPHSEFAQNLIKILTEGGEKNEHKGNVLL